MQTDPIGYTSDLDLYAYVGNDPIDGTDPSGLCDQIKGNCPPPPPPPKRAPGNQAAPNQHQIQKQNRSDQGLSAAMASKAHGKGERGITSKPEFKPKPGGKCLRA